MMSKLQAGGTQNYLRIATEEAWAPEMFAI